MPSTKCYQKEAQDKNKKLIIPRATTVPDLLPVVGRPPKLTKLLLNVTIQRSTGPVQVVMSQEATVMELVVAVLKQYAKEGRRPVLSSVDAFGFELHYSQFSLESLDMEEKLVSLGSRNFFLCPKKATVAAENSSSSWLKFMDFSL